MRHLLIGALLLGPSAAAAQPAAPSDCEGIRNDLAYNRCLASFGPKRGERARPARPPTSLMLRRRVAHAARPCSAATAARRRRSTW